MSAPESPSDPDYGFLPGDDVKVEVLRFGTELEPVLVIDEVMRRPQTLIDHAARHAGFSPLKQAENFYPGLRAPAPADYVQGLYQTIAPILARAFGHEANSPASITCALSMVTLPPQQLNLAQRLPHYDASEAREIAVLHYFCDASHGGTAFYRHRATGFETVDEARLERYLAVLNAELKRYGPPPARYVSGSTPVHEEIGRVEARMNRLIAYRGRTLHSGLIPNPYALSSDPLTGRLTANTFVTIG